MVNRLHLRAGAALVAIATLTSCGTGGSGGGNASDPPAEGAYTIRPGEYETAVRITNVSLEGFPPEVQEQLRQAQQNPMTDRQCMPFTFSMESMNMRNMRFQIPATEGGPTGGCNIAEISSGGGQTSGSMSCEFQNLPQGGPDAPRAIRASLTFNGTYSADTSTLTVQGEATEPGNDSRRGTVTLEISSRRVGDCPARPSYTPPPTTNYQTYNSSTYAPSTDYGGNSTYPTNTTTNMVSNSAYK